MGFESQTETLCAVMQQTLIALPNRSSTCRALATLPRLAIRSQGREATMQIPQLKFDLGEDIDMLRDSVYAFAQDEIAPRRGD